MKTMKRKIFLAMIMIMSMSFVLSAQTPIIVPKDEPEKETIVIAVSSLEIVDSANFNLPDAKSISLSLATVFSGLLSNYKIPGVEIASRMSETVIQEENKTIFSYDYKETSGVEAGNFLRANYLLQGKIIVFTTGTILFTAQIIDAEKSTIVASIKSGYITVKEVEQLLTLVDDMTYELLENFTVKIGIKE